MSIIEQLKQDHDRQRDLSKRIAETSGDSEERQSLWSDLRRELESHADAEEQTLYAAMLKYPKTQPEARHSIAEHKTLSDLIEELDGTPMDQASWLVTFKTLADKVAHHLDEEEEEFFAKAREQMGESELKLLGKDFEERKQTAERAHR